MRNSRRNSKSVFAAFLTSLSLYAAPALAQTPLPASGQINSTGHDVTLTVPFKDGAFYVGDIVITIGKDNTIHFQSKRLLELLSQELQSHIIDKLRGNLAAKTSIGPADLAGSNIAVSYNPQTLELVAAIPSDMKIARGVALANMNGQKIGTFAEPAGLSAYLNMRGAIDYVHKGSDPGLGDPLMFLDGAMRAGPLVLESQGIWQPGAITSFQRQNTRFVYDDTDHVMRWSLGDLDPVTAGFQSTPDMAGISVFRSYGVLQPEHVASPHGDQTFQLNRPSTVEVFVNGFSVRRLRLQPGNYNLRDFPFTQGANDILLSIVDDTGGQQTLRFNVFFDQNQLEAGLSEFGLYAGVNAPLADSGPHYTNDPEITGFYRRGVAQDLTLGANFQADKIVQMGGVEGLWGSPLGTLGFDLALSNVKHYGNGYAATLTLQRLFQHEGGQSDSLNLSFQTRSKDFGQLGILVPDNRYAYELSGSYSHGFNERFYAGGDARFSRGRGINADSALYRVTTGYRISTDLALQLDGTYQQQTGQKGPGAMLTLTWQMGEASNIRAQYDTRSDLGVLSYQTLQGSGVGSYNIAGDINRSPSSGGFDASANYTANRAEIGLAHSTAFDSGSFNRISDERTSLRMGTSIAMADGAFAIGRPIYDGFAIIEPHKSLHGADVTVNPTPYGYIASSDALGPALDPELSAYTERNVAVDVPNAPPGYDIGSGTLRAFPPYRSGYRFVVGSDYFVTAIGRLIGADGKPVSLLEGKAIEIAAPEREPVEIFTNRDGKFGASGLRSGKWRIEMPTEPASIFIIDIPAAAKGLVVLGEVKPSETEK